MHKPLFRWQKHSVVTLVPGSGVQFLDFAIGDALAATVTQPFLCEIRPNELDDSGRPAELLHLVSYDEDKEPMVTIDGRRRGVASEEVVTIRGEKALETLAGRWLPAPVLRIGEDGTMVDGPVNWARLFVSRLASPDGDGNRWRVTLALDTLLVDRPADNRYVAPEPRDAAEMALFGLATRHDTVNFFIRTPWVRDWLRDAFLDAESLRRGRKITLDQLDHPGLYWAHYLVLLKLLGSADDPACDALPTPVIPRLRFLDVKPYARDRKPVPVTLVLDIGNSRTCGILIEEPPEGTHRQRVDMSQAYRLELRNLSDPAQCCADPFESRVEFATTTFNLGAYSRVAGRPVRDAFWWPSPVRVGPEAAWLASLTDGTQGRSGLSSPKRYVWDGNERPTPWVNTGGQCRIDQRPAPIRGPIISRLSQRGTPLKPGEMAAMKPLFARNTLYTLMLAEILSHALGQINSPATRGLRPDAEEPRQLRRIILTVPSATPVAELKMLKRLTGWSLSLLWQAMGWTGDHPLYRKPDLRLDWDEATATHLVYLYNEITQKLQIAPRDVFALLRRPRPVPPPPQPTLRIASIDIGGGTTDLMIIQHEVSDNDRTILPRQLFREGFRLAGDDILKQVIEDEVLPAIGRRLGLAGIERPDLLLLQKFSGDREGMPQQERTLRALFVTQVLRPAALALLSRYEQHRAPAEALSVRLVDPEREGTPPRQEVIDYLEDAARRAGAVDLTLAALTIDTTAARVSATINAVVEPMLTDLCDVVRAYECDVLLLSGRPSRFPAIKQLIFGQAPVPPGRIVAMDSYEVGTWYPFHSPNHRLEDPKTTAAVGAMLCHLCESQVEGMLLRTSEIRVRSTARFIGVMELNDRIPTEKLIFKEIDLDSGERCPARSVSVTPPAFIGYRQLPIDRWKTTPLYYLDFRNRSQVQDLRMPLTVTLERAEPNDDDDDSALEEFSIREARDAANRDVETLLRLSFQTLRVERDLEGGYWLDSGVLSINWRS